MDLGNGLNRGTKAFGPDLQRDLIDGSRSLRPAGVGPCGPRRSAGGRPANTEFRGRKLGHPSAALDPLGRVTSIAWQPSQARSAQRRPPRTGRASIPVVIPDGLNVALNATVKLYSSGNRRRGRAADLAPLLVAIHRRSSTTAQAGRC